MKRSLSSSIGSAFFLIVFLSSAFANDEYPYLNEKCIPIKIAHRLEIAHLK